MKKIYTTPELTVVEFTLKDVILSSPTEDPIGEVIGGGGSGGGSFDGLDGDL